MDATLRIDEIGVGKGLMDRLTELGYYTDGFNASRRPRGELAGTRFQNDRARIAYAFREALIQGEIAIPPDEMLLQELRV